MLGGIEGKNLELGYSSSSSHSTHSGISSVPFGLTSKGIQDMRIICDHDLISIFGKYTRDI